MVNLTRIYTRTGDHGQTRLSDMSETSKTDPRVEAYGAIDEANCLLGLARSRDDLPEGCPEALAHIQNELFDVGADLSNPLRADPPTPPLRVEPEYIERLEQWCDHFGAGLAPLRSFVLPGGPETAALLHLARSVVRRAERQAWAAAEAYGTEPSAGDEPGGVNALAIKYLNRLSDLLFILARVVAQPIGETLWIPGIDRTPPDAGALLRRQRIQGRPDAFMAD
ncbi:MAG: cob(I)yrinic acid a,c-diamide adenosyltransferase [Propionibacteriaceae bacterium]|jgi:cob(I)alamin adenosyltransferase|nr:cob(I)yrinic acid a,c-diamide adenosyltransferase [Propionibacteriaceae bacterium]